MAYYIYHLLAMDLIVFLSWAPANFVAICYGLEFNVSTNDFQGKVRVQYVKDRANFDIVLFNSNGKAVARKYGLNPNELINNIGTMLKYRSHQLQAV